jgi:hypothetical protein
MRNLQFTLLILRTRKTIMTGAHESEMEERIIYLLARCNLEKGRITILVIDTIHHLHRRFPPIK